MVRNAAIGGQIHRLAAGDSIRLCRKLLVGLAANAVDNASYLF